MAFCGLIFFPNRSNRFLLQNPTIFRNFIYLPFLWVKASEGSILEDVKKNAESYFFLNISCWISYTKYFICIDLLF